MAQLEMRAHQTTPEDTSEWLKKVFEGTLVMEIDEMEGVNPIYLSDDGWAGRGGG